MTRQPEHPRLLFDAEEVATIRGRLTGARGRRLLAHAVGYCERYLDPADALYFDFRELKNGYWRNRAGNFIVPGHMAALALVGWLAERRDFLEAARDALLAVIREKLADQVDPDFERERRPAAGAPTYLGWRRGNQHDSGKFFFALGFLFDTLQGVLSAEQRRTVLAYADETLGIGRANLTREAALGAGDNRSGRFATGLCVLATAIETEPGVDGALAKRLADEGPKRLERTLRWSYGRDGEPYEGNSYGLVADFYLLCAEAYARAGRRDLRGDARFDALSDYLASELVVADGFFNNQNDCSPGQLAQTLLWSGCRHRRPAALWTWDQTGGNESHPNGMTREGAHASNLGLVPWGLLWMDDETEARRPDLCGYPLDRHFRERGIVTMRTGWEPDSIHATLFSGRQGHTAHCHHDLNQVTFYGLGERFLVDIGYWTRDPGTGGVLAGWPAEAHNLVSVDGVVQRGRHTSDWAEGRIDAFETRADYAYTLGDAREALGSVSRSERHFFLSRRPEAAPYAIWIDDVEVDGTGAEHDFKLFLHTAPGNRFVLESDRVSVQGARATLDIHLAAPFSPRLSVGAYGPFPRLEIAGRSARGRFALLLHPRRAGEPAARFRAVSRPESVETEITLGQTRHRYRFNTAPRPEVATGEGRITLDRLE